MPEDFVRRRQDFFARYLSTAQTGLQCLRMPISLESALIPARGGVESCQPPPSPKKA